MLSALLVFVVTWGGVAPLQSHQGETANEIYGAAIKQYQGFQIDKRINVPGYDGLDDGLVRDIRAVLEVVAKGNRASVVRPKEFRDEAMMFPRLALHKALAKRFVLLAESDFQSANPESAIHVLGETIRYGQNLALMGGLSQQAVAGVVQQISLKPLWEHRTEIHGKSAKRLQVVAKSESVDRQAREEIDLLLADSEQRSKSLQDFFEPLGISSDDQIKSMLTDKEASEFLAEFAEFSKRFHEHLTIAISHPETEWSQRGRTIFKNEYDEEEFSGEVFAVMAWEHVPDYFEMIIKHKTRMRLLSVIANLSLYREKQGVFPRSLEALGARKVITDPLTGSAFNYELTAESYELFSNGTQQTGRIYLSPRPDHDKIDPR